VIQFPKFVTFYVTNFGTITLERIVIDRNHRVVPADYVNPLYIKQLEQIYRTDESPKASLIDSNLL
jgi:hypothetical protein